MDKEKQIERNCNNCKRQHTRYCPNSSECISLPNLPYFETDVIRLLEHDWDMHEKKIYELEAENDRLEMKLKQCIDGHSSMCDMNVGLMHDMENMKAENERLTKQLAVANRALNNSVIKYDCNDCPRVVWEKCDGDCTPKKIAKFLIQQATKELEEQDK